MDYTGIFKQRPNGYHPGLTFDQYAMAPGVNNSLLKQQTALEMWHDLQIDPVIKQSELTESRAASFAQGELNHKLILEPHLLEGDGVEEYFQYSPTVGLTTDKAIKAFQADPTRPLITPRMYDIARRVRDGIHKHKRLNQMLSQSGQREMTGFAWDEEHKVMRKIRADFRPDNPNNWILDLKSTSKGLSRGEVYNTTLSLNYGMQAKFYLDTDALISGFKREFFCIAFMKIDAPPYFARLFYLQDGGNDPDDLLKDGGSKYDSRLSIFCAAAAEFERRALGKHPDPAGAWEAYENEDEPVLIRKQTGAWR